MLGLISLEMKASWYSESLRKRRNEEGLWSLTNLGSNLAFTICVTRHDSFNLSERHFLHP